MPAQKRYEPFPAMVTPEQHAFIREHAASRDITQNQAVRDMIEHARTCPFFNGNTSTNGNIPQMKKD